MIWLLDRCVVIRLWACFDRPIGACAPRNVCIFEPPPRIVGVASHWHHYFGGRGLKSLGTPDLG